MSEPENLTHRLLREMRAEMASGFEQIRSDIEKLRGEAGDQRVRVESVRQMAIGESFLGRYTVAEVEERPEDLDKRLAALEARS